MIGAFEGASKATKNVASKINEKIHDPNLKESIKETGSKVATEAK